MSRKSNIEVTRNKLIIVVSLITIFSFIMSACIAFSVTNETSKHNKQDIEELNTVQDEIEEDVNDIKTSIAVFQNVADDVKIIKTTILNRGETCGYND